jgi:hypothetical protein
MYFEICVFMNMDAYEYMNMMKLLPSGLCIGISFFFVTKTYIYLHVSVQIDTFIYAIIMY